MALSLRSTVALFVISVFSSACLATRHDPTLKEDPDFVLGLEQLMIGNYYLARSHFSQAVRENPQNNRAHAGLILAETYRVPDHPDYHILVSRAARLGFDDFRILDLCGRQTYDHSNGDFALIKKAEALFISALTTHPNNPSSHYYLGMIYIDLGDRLNARKYFSATAKTESDWQDRAIERLAEIEQ